MSRALLKAVDGWVQVYEAQRPAANAVAETDSALEVDVNETQALPASGSAAAAATLTPARRGMGILEVLGLVARWTPARGNWRPASPADYDKERDMEWARQREQEMLRERESPTDINPRLPSTCEGEDYEDGQGASGPDAGASSLDDSHWNKFFAQIYSPLHMTPSKRVTEAQQLQTHPHTQTHVEFLGSPCTPTRLNQPHTHMAADSSGILPPPLPTTLPIFSSDEQMPHHPHTPPPPRSPSTSSCLGRGAGGGNSPLAAHVWRALSEQKYKGGRSGSLARDREKDDSYWMAMFGHSRASSFCGDPSVDSSGFGDGDDLDMSELGDFDVDLTGYDWDVRGGCLNGCSDPFHELGQNPSAEAGSSCSTTWSGADTPQYSFFGGSRWSGVDTPQYSASGSARLSGSDTPYSMWSGADTPQYSISGSARVPPKGCSRVTTPGFVTPMVMEEEDGPLRRSGTGRAGFFPFFSGAKGN